MVETGGVETDRAATIIAVNSLTLLLTVGFLSFIFRLVKCPPALARPDNYLLVQTSEQSAAK